MTGPDRAPSAFGDDDDVSFLAPPGAACDWRMVLAYDAAAGAGLVAGLPAGAADLAARLRIDGHAVEVVLEALALWGVVEADADGVYRLGPAAPPPDESAVLRHHAMAAYARGLCRPPTPGPWMTWWRRPEASGGRDLGSGPRPSRALGPRLCGPGSSRRNSQDLWIGLPADHAAAS